MGKVYIKVHEIPYQGKVLAVSDEGIIGKTLNDEERDIVFEVSEEFYKGEQIDIEKLGEFLEKEDNINIIGNAAVDAAVKFGVVREEDTIVIDGIKHAQIYRV